jgi:hypothetical protein
MDTCYRNGLWSSGCGELLDQDKRTLATDAREHNLSKFITDLGTELRPGTNLSDTDNTALKAAASADLKQFGFGDVNIIGVDVDGHGVNRIRVRYDRQLAVPIMDQPGRVKMVYLKPGEYKIDQNGREIDALERITGLVYPNGNRREFEYPEGDSTGVVGAIYTPFGQQLDRARSWRNYADGLARNLDLHTHTVMNSVGIDQRTGTYYEQNNNTRTEYYADGRVVVTVQPDGTIQDVARESLRIGGNGNPSEAQISAEAAKLLKENTRAADYVVKAGDSFNISTQ